MSTPDLVALALAARAAAYAPYSRFAVGAALLDDAGRAHRGANVENASYGLACCAERTALFSAVSAGARRFTTLAVASAGGVPPCGACRQVLHEFAPRLELLLVDADAPAEAPRRTTLAALLPEAFGPRSLDGARDAD